MYRVGTGQMRSSLLVVSNQLDSCLPRDLQNCSVYVVQKERGKGNPPKNWKVLKERRQQIKQKLKRQADDWMRN